MSHGSRCAFFFVLLAVALVPSWGCGGGSSGDGDGGGGGSAVLPPGTTPVIDVALRGDDGLNPRIHIYRDVLAGPTSGAEPDITILSPPSIKKMAFIGTHLLLAADYGTPGNSLLLYRPADLAQAVPLPTATILLPVVPGATLAQIQTLVIHNEDVYVLCTFSDQLNPATFTIVTYIYRDVSTLTNASVPDASIQHDQIVVTGLFASSNFLSVVQGVLWATTIGNVYRNLAPENLVGPVTPDLTLDLRTDLGLEGRESLVMSRGDAYLINREVIAFADGKNLSAGQQPLFTLAGPSGTLAVPDAFLRLRGRLFSLGLFPIVPISIVGHDVAGPVLDYAPPDVLIGPPIFGQQILDGVADTLFAASSQQGTVAIYRSASALEDGAEPDIYLWEPDIIQAKELRVAER